ncbi:hypothetical protein DAPPUDRAFT_238539 [Daphnia pulex]|uniref:Uncharacterized protein n=1 Tax=Daphnia pulex TaxID=6669 RepID=E9G6M7_DAPPU|nr:hypothetical protein DAPPUDRAFT_238539 [Daphnia pulex]|eukprot:EFX84964.1 hypothetical protein DAPPUDRAFT_238539 [Daphnia pulex]
MPDSRDVQNSRPKKACRCRIIPQSSLERHDSSGAGCLALPEKEGGEGGGGGGEEEEEEKDNSTTTAMKISRAHIVPTQIRNVHHRLDKLKRSYSSQYENVYTPPPPMPVPIFLFVNVVVVVLESKPISHCPLLTEGNRQSKEAH